jgi:DNA repair exonuclease SbcCD ATPase subunit
MLIKAPIGSGKSFLFFDGPIYGLYKYSSRNILNTKSKDGFIKVMLEVNQETYLIIRNIKKGKSKDSCESKLYKIEGDLSLFNEESPVQNDKDIELMLKQQSNLKRDEVTFKNETDLQQTLQTILPPREVIMNTIFLMQDSDNIFELTPLDRLTILKNVFNLMGIDEAKEVLADKKREIRYKIKATTDISKYDEKLKTNIQKYLSTFTTTKELLGNMIDTKVYEQFFEERKMIEEKIQITDFSLKDFPTDREQKLHDYIEQKKSQEQKLTHQLETIQKNITEEQKKLQEQQQSEKELSASISALQKKIDNIDEKKIELLKQQKQEIITQQNSNEAQIPREKIWEFIKKE